MEQLPRRILHGIPDWHTWRILCLSAGEAAVVSAGWLHHWSNGKNLHEIHQRTSRAVASVGARCGVAVTDFGFPLRLNRLALRFLAQCQASAFAGSCCF